MRQWIWPVFGVIVGAALPFLWHIQTLQREHGAEQALHVVRAAQAAFRAAGGGGGFATDLASLQTPCAGLPPLEPAAPASDAVAGYVITLRIARGSTPAGVDCHGRPTSADYYAAAAPAPGRTDG